MINNLNYISQNQQFSNQLINPNTNAYGLPQRLPKKVTFLETITIYNVESFKELNKLLTYNAEEGLQEYMRSHSHPFYDYKSLYDHKHSYYSNPNTKIRRDPNSDECCLLL